MFGNWASVPGPVGFAVSRLLLEAQYYCFDTESGTVHSGHRRQSLVDEGLGVSRPQRRRSVRLDVARQRLSTSTEPLPEYDGLDIHALLA